MPKLITLKQLSDHLAQKKYSSVELTKHFLKQIDQHNKQINCFISVCHEDALQSAAEADRLLAANKAHPLTGIPIAHKDIFCTKGIKTSCASKMLDNFIAPYNATIVDKLQRAGTVMLGKLNMDEFAMGSCNENSHYGPVRNPWDLDATPGGSSGGSAAAVACGLAAAATGSDTGGSIRQPAAFCGLTGLKPTYGRVSRHGMVAFASSLDQAGPMGVSAEDTAMMLQEMAGYDEKDSTSAKEEVPNYSASLNEPLKGLKIGLPKEYFSDDLDPESAQAIMTCKQQLQQLGCTFKEVSLEHTHLGVAAYYILAPSEASANLARYDGARYGYRCENPRDLEDMYKRSRSEGFGYEVKRRILLGTYMLSSGYYDAYYLKAQKIRRKVRDDFIKAFQDVDVLLAPITPTAAYDFQENRDPASTYLGDIFTVPVNLAGLPGLAFPVGFTKKKRPIGAQLIAPHFAEARLLNIAHQYQQQTDWHLQQAPHAASHEDLL